MTSNTFWIDWKDFGKRMSAELGTTSIEAGHGRIAQSREESETTARFLTKQRPPTSKIEKCQLSISSWSTLVWLTLAQARPTSRRKMKKKKGKTKLSQTVGLATRFPIVTSARELYIHSSRRLGEWNRKLRSIQEAAKLGG